MPQQVTIIRSCSHPCYHLYPARVRLHDTSATRSYSVDITNSKPTFARRGHARSASQAPFILELAFVLATDAPERVRRWSLGGFNANPQRRRACRKSLHRQQKAFERTSAVRPECELLAAASSHAAPAETLAFARSGLPHAHVALGFSHITNPLLASHGAYKALLPSARMRWLLRRGAHPPPPCRCQNRASPV